MDPAGVSQQRRVIERTAALHGLHVAETGWFVDNGIGGHVTNSPAWERLIASVTLGVPRPRILIVRDLTRLGRNPVEAASRYVAAAALGLRVITHKLANPAEAVAARAALPRLMMRRSPDGNGQAGRVARLKKGAVPQAAAAAERPIAAVYVATAAGASELADRFAYVVQRVTADGYRVPNDLRCGDLLTCAEDGVRPGWEEMINRITRMRVRPQVLAVGAPHDLGVSEDAILRRHRAGEDLGVPIIKAGDVPRGATLLIDRILGVQSRLEAQMRSAAVKRGLAAHRLPIGYAREEACGRWVPAQDGSVDVVQGIFSDYAGGCSLREVATRANHRDGRPGRREWTRGRIRRVLCSSDYDPSVKGDHPPIIPQELVDHVRERLGRGSRQHPAD
jgi:DNA invertase Pin-like site-specific DNA recombinase